MAVNPTDSKQVTDNPNVVNQENAGQDSDINPATSSEGKNSDSNSIPYGVYKKLKDDFSDFKSKFSALEEKQTKARESKMKEEGQLKELLAEKEAALEKAATKVQEWDDYKTSRRESLLTEIPEDDRDIYAGLSLDNLEKHVQKVQTVKGSPFKVDGSPAKRKIDGKAEFGGYASYEEWAAKDPKGYVKANNSLESQGIKVGY